MSTESRVLGDLAVESAFESLSLQFDERAAHSTDGGQ